MRKTRFSLAVLMCMLPSAAFAQSCPMKIAVLTGDPLSITAKGILFKVYGDLGCKPEFISLPAKRAVLYMNSGAVDGEIYRLRLIEPHYTVPVVRSRIPLMKMKNAVWDNPDTTIAASKPTGYVRGIKWHEEYASNPEASSRKFKEFNTEDHLYDAYKRGVIGGFLSEKQSVDYLTRENFFAEPPVLGVIVNELSLYHYLRADYEPFMARFSEYLAKHNPFSVLE